MRCYSNLHESLHHSHYAYLLADADTLIPFQLSGPLLYVPPILALVLRAGAAHISVHPPASAYVRAATSVGWVHAVAIAWLLPPLSPVLKTGSSGAAGRMMRFDIPRSCVHDTLDA